MRKEEGVWERRELSSSQVLYNSCHVSLDAIYTVGVFTPFPNPYLYEHPHGRSRSGLQTLDYTR